MKLARLKPNKYRASALDLKTGRCMLFGLPFGPYSVISDRDADAGPSALFFSLQRQCESSPHEHVQKALVSRLHTEIVPPAICDLAYQHRQFLLDLLVACFRCQHEFIHACCVG